MARREPHRLAVVSVHGSSTFGELVAMADRIRSALAGLALPAGSVIATDVPSGPDFFALALAALRSGHGLRPIGGKVPEERRATLLADAGTVLDVRRQPTTGPAAVASSSLSRLLAGSPGVPDDTVS